MVNGICKFWFEFCHLYFRYTNPHKKDDRRKAWDHEEVRTSFPGTWMLKFRDSKRSQRGCKRKLMVNLNLFLYMLLFEPSCLKSADIFYFSVSVSFSLKEVCTSTNRELCMFIENFFLIIWNLSCSVFIYGKVFVTITLLERQYISWKHTMAVHCHGNRFLNASLFASKNRENVMTFSQFFPPLFPWGIGTEPEPLTSFSCHWSKDIAAILALLSLTSICFHLLHYAKS